MVRMLRDTNDATALRATIAAAESLDGPSPAVAHELEVAQFRLKQLLQERPMLTMQTHPARDLK